MLRVSVDISGAVRMLDNIKRDLPRDVLQPALNKVADKARAEINRAIPAEFAVKPADVRNAIEVRRARPGNLEAVITIFGSSSKRGRSMNLVRFLAAVQAVGKAMKVRGAKVKKKDLGALGRQLGFQIKAGGGLKQIEGAFVGNKGRTIFRRVGKGRLPIEPVQVIGFSQMFNTRRISRRVLDKINAELPIEIERAMQMMLGRK